MSVRFTCECGTLFLARDEQAGNPAVCHVCKRQFVVPVQNDPQSGQPVSPTVLPQNPLKEEESHPQTPVGAESARPFWKDPIVVIGTAIPTLILLAFCGYLAWPRPRANAETARPPAGEIVVAERSPTDPVGAAAR